MLVLALPTKGPAPAAKAAAAAKSLKHVAFDHGTGVFSTNASTDFSDGSTDFSDGMQKTAHD